MPGPSPSAFHAYAINAVKVSGVLVRVEESEFLKVLGQIGESLVVISERRFLQNKYRYLTSYKGFILATESPNPLALPASAEIVKAKFIWLP